MGVFREEYWSGLPFSTPDGKCNSLNKPTFTLPGPLLNSFPVQSQGCSLGGLTQRLPQAWHMTISLCPIFLQQTGQALVTHQRAVGSGEELKMTVFRGHKCLDGGALPGLGEHGKVQVRGAACELQSREYWALFWLHPGYFRMARSGCGSEREQHRYRRGSPAMAEPRACHRVRREVGLGKGLGVGLGGKAPTAGPGSHCQHGERRAWICRKRVIQEGGPGDFPAGPGVKSALPMQGAQVQSLVRELDLTCCN